MAAVQNFSDIDTSKIKFSDELFKGDGGKRYSEISYGEDDDGALVVQYPILKCIGVSSENDGYIIDLKIPRYFRELFMLDKIAVDTVYKKRKEWIGKDGPRYKLEECYRPNIKISPRSGAKFIRFKLPESFVLFDEKFEKTTNENIKVGKNLSLIVHVASLRFGRTMYEYIIYPMYGKLGDDGGEHAESTTKTKTAPPSSKKYEPPKLTNNPFLKHDKVVEDDHDEIEQADDEIEQVDVVDEIEQVVEKDDSLQINKLEPEKMSLEQLREKYNIPLNVEIEM